MYIKSAFTIMLAVYLLLILAEAIQPGFVSHYFSAHWLLLLALVLFVALLRRGHALISRPSVELMVALFAGLVAGVVTWNLGEPLGALRLILSLAAVALPFVFIHPPSSNL